MSELKLCGQPATHAVSLLEGHGFYFACEACVELARAAHPDSVNVRPIREAEVGRPCVVPGINC